jgi:hypothetical protein
LKKYISAVPRIYLKLAPCFKYVLKKFYRKTTVRVQAFSTKILSHNLKVPKREIFDRSDFPDFYTIKSLRVGDFGFKIKNCLKIFRGSFRQRWAAQHVFEVRNTQFHIYVFVVRKTQLRRFSKFASALRAIP